MNIHQSTIAALCMLLLVQTFATSEAQPQSSTRNKRPYRGTGGWTMNSIGYNAGLEALQKLFGKRSGGAMEEPSFDDDLTLSLGEDNIRALVDEFVSFLELKESGLLGPSLVHCLKAELTTTMDK